MIVDLCAGIGGWDLAFDDPTEVVGIEIDRDACATRNAIGLTTVRADITAAPFGPVTIDGICASPPCQTFSSAGKGDGRQALGDLCRAVMHGADVAVADGKTELVLEPLRWTLEHRPRWLVAEQVPPVLPVWEAIAWRLGQEGYSTWAGVLNAADFGSIEACPLHDTQRPIKSAADAAAYSPSATALACAGKPAMTPTAEEPIGDALIVAAHLVSPIALACADAATCGERLGAVLQLAREGAPTRVGRAADAWTSAATSTFGSAGDTAESIGSWLSQCWDDLYRAGRLSTTSMATPPTTILRTLRSIAATLTTGPHTGPASRTAGCGLCLDAGVPQTRKRAILIASLDREVGPPAATHARDPQPSMFGELLPWVSMADALGWIGKVGFPRRDDLGDSPDGYRERDWRSTDGPAFGLTEKARSWVVRTGANSMKFNRNSDDIVPYERPVTELAPTVDVKAGHAWVVNTGRDWKKGGTRDDAQQIPMSEPAPTVGVTNGPGDWHLTRPATTVACDPRLSPPGWRGRPEDYDDDGEYLGVRSMDDAIRLTLADALILQDFPPDLPVLGTKTAQFRQVGNAIPVGLARAILEVVR